MSSTYGSTSGTLNPIIYSNIPQNNIDNFYIDNITSATNIINLVGGKYYYSELYHINVGDTGFIKIYAQIPNNNTSLAKQTYQINYI
jgi:predicted methyltransferase